MNYRKYFALFLGLFFAFVLVSGCTTTYVPLSESANGKINSTDHIVVQVQSEIKADINRSNMGAAGFGLIGALVDVSMENSRTKTAESLIKPVRDVLLNYNFEDRVVSELANVLEKNTWLNSKSLKLEFNQDENFVDNAIKKSTSDAVGIIKPTYILSPLFDELKVQFEYLLFPASESFKKSAGIEDSESPIYKTIVEQKKELIGASQNKEVNAQRWAENNGQKIKEALEDLIKQTAQKLYSEL